MGRRQGGIETDEMRGDSIPMFPASLDAIVLDSSAATSAGALW